MQWYYWLVVVLFLVALALIFLRGCNIMGKDKSRELIREDEFGRRI